MNLNRLSIRTILAGAIFVIGNLAVVLVYVSSEVFRSSALARETVLVQKLVTKDVLSLQREIENEALYISNPLVDNPSFIKAVNALDRDEVEAHLKQRIDSYLDSRSGGAIKKLYFFDSTLQYIAQSPQLIYRGLLVPGMCSRIRTRAMQAVNKGENSAIHGICNVDKNYYVVSVIPVVGDELEGFIEIIALPQQYFSIQEDRLGMPMQVTHKDGSTIYQSTSWPVSLESDTHLLVATVLDLASSNSPLTVKVAHDIEILQSNLSQISYYVLVISAIVTLLVIGVSVRVLQKTAIDPIAKLTYQVGKISNDQTQLGTRVEVEGNAEVFELAQGFNEMTAKLRESHDNLERMAFMDALTKLPNRTLFFDRLEQTVLASRRTERTFAVCIMDLDRFKEINDTVGHHVGDLLLQQVGARLVEQLRKSDTVARLGGDEFAVLLQGVDQSLASQMTAALLESLRQPFEVGGDRFYISASAGIAMYPRHGDDVSNLMQHADVAMYAAKNEKKGYTVYSVELDRDSSSRLALMGGLREAVENKSFELFYQPKINLKTLEIEGVEALVRWRQDGHDVSSPEIFIPILEQTGQIRSLTQWVLENALQQYQDWKDQGLNTSIAVNLSTRDLQDPDIPIRISTLLAEKQISSNRLELEITESAIMHDPIRALDTLEHIAAMGINITIDDFGTGYSSLSYLKRLPATAVKIDKSFVIGMVQDAHDATIVSASVELAHNLGLKVVAEGVESQDVMQLLVEQGCDSAQGYYISRPMSADDFLRWVKSSPWPLQRSVA
ncbi:MAG: EAL domain-containing protein [Acidiferrobacterales bacterium]